LVSTYQKYNVLISLFLLFIIGISIALPAIYFYNYKNLFNINVHVSQQNILFSLAYYKVMHEAYLQNYSYSKLILKSINNFVLINQNIENLINRVNIFLDLIINQLNETKENISLGYYYLNIGNVSYAYNLSKKAFKSIENANYSTIWLADLYSEIYNSIGPYNYLQKGLNEIEISEGNLTYQINQLMEKINSYKGNVTVNLYSNVTEAWVGNVTRIYGNVTYLHNYISNATVELIFPDYSINVTTNSYGQFSYNYKIPYIYDNKTCIYAIFIPNKLYNYLHENSSIICIKNLFIDPKIEIHINKTKILPNTYLKIYGQLLNISPYINKSIIIYIRQINLIKVINISNNNFSTNLLIPDIPNGNYTLIFILPSNRIYNKALFVTNINVYRLIPKINFTMAKTALSGETITIKGVAYFNNTYLNNSVIKISYLGNNIITKTNSKGEFQAKITIPPTYMNSHINVTLLLIPNESYFSQISESREVFIINPIALVLGTAILLSSLKYIYDKERKKESKNISNEVEKNNKTPEILSTRKKILSDAFSKFVSNIYFNYGLILEDSMTLREYFKVLNTKIISKEKISRLLSLLEREIYGFGLNYNEFDELITLLLGDFK